MLTVSEKNNIHLVKLQNGVTNALSRELIKKLSDTIDNLSNASSGLIIGGGEKFFSIGFNIPELIKFSKEEIIDFYRSFNDFILKLVTLPIPTCCAINGHAIAGGCILALGTDFRVASVGKKLMGLNEVKLGLPVPLIADMLLRQAISYNNANLLLYTGEFINTLQAKEIGLVNEVCSEEEVEEKAFEKISMFLDKPLYAFSEIKKNKTDFIIREFLARRKDDEDSFIKCWLRDNTKKLLIEASQKF